MKKQFLVRVEAALADIPKEALDYNREEFWMIKRPYEYIEQYVNERELFNTAIALPLARGLHDGSHRKSGVTRDGEFYRLPYVIHCLLVCRMLLDLQVPLAKEEEDVLLAASLCHDMIEDLPFTDGGRELSTVYHLDPRVYEVVKKVSKRRDFTPEEEQAHFDTIQEDPLALLVKLSDRGNNVEDLYNMKIRKVHEYIGETRRYFFDMCSYGKAHYPGLYEAYEVLEDKIRGLTEMAEILVDRYVEMDNSMNAQIQELQQENERLRRTWQELKAREVDA